MRSVPLSDPLYKYPPSKNPYYARMGELEGLIFWDNGTEEHRGAWRSKFTAPADARAPLHVEIGCNGGHVILEQAALAPGVLHIGLDWKFKQIHRGAEKARKRGLKNLLFFRANAERLKYMFGPGEIDRLSLYFPDPWAKKSQLKNRFLTAPRLRDVAEVVRSGGVFHIKTDHAGYFEWMKAAIAEVGDLWETVSLTHDLHAGHPDPKSLKIPAVTLFERLFIADGLPVHSVELRRR